MAPGDTAAADNVKQHKLRTKCVSRSPEVECVSDGSFVFEAHEAWKDFHNSLRQFYENGELCDVTLKVSAASHLPAAYFPLKTQQHMVSSLHENKKLICIQ